MNSRAIVPNPKQIRQKPGETILQRRCACGKPIAANGECAECNRKRQKLQRKAMNQNTPETVPPIVHEVLRESGRPLEPAPRAFMESRFGHDFSQVRVHTNAKASESAQAVNALAYTVGQNMVFGAGKYTPETNQGRELLAHELTHTIQQKAGNSSNFTLPLSNSSTESEKEAGEAATRIIRDQQPGAISRAAPQIARQTCTSSSICSPTGTPGSAQGFGDSEEAREVGPRTRRRGMTPARAISTSHAGRARQLETFLNSEEPGRLSNIQGIFVDQDLSSGTGAMVQDCAAWAADSLPAGSPTPPGMAGATKPCAFVHGQLNQEAFAFNRTSNPNIGGISRDQWRVDTLQLLIHETEHPRFETATTGRAQPAGVTTPTCTRSNIEGELSEIAAVMSEFPTIFNAATAEANPTGPFHVSLNNWFQQSIHTGGENIQGALTQIGCSCNCGEVDAFVIDTFNEVTSSGAWSVAQKNAFNAKLRTELAGPVRPIWPL